VRRAVYTAIFGGYDELKAAPAAPEGVDCICFTDDAGMHALGWEMRVEPQGGDPRMIAKRYKVLSHRVLPAYDETLWIDGSFRCTSERFVVEALGYLEREPLALFPHPDRSSILDEAEACTRIPKYAVQPILAQVESYRATGYEDTRLFASGIVARKNVAPVARLNERWWEENCRWSTQCQLSLPFVLAELVLTPALFPYDLWSSPWGRWEDHALEYSLRKSFWSL
jgi:hypothetical protein